MIWPELVPDFMCTTDIHVTIDSEEVGEEGQPIHLLDADLKCNYQDKGKRILTNEQKIVQITGSALFNGDIAPDIPVISGGTVRIFGIERGIAVGEKARNMDGTVNYTRLELI
ncbi:MAG: hypothetical protein SOV36_02530 [Anaerostipes faecalis]|nr:hypothetical protein [Anaerostipes faecalis]